MKIAVFEDNKKFRESLEFVIVTSKDLELCGSFEDTTRLQQRIEAPSLTFDPTWQQSTLQ